jgi:hypothetical protein
VGGSFVLLGAYLLNLQIHTGSFENSQWGDMASGFFQGRHLLGLGSTWCGAGRLSAG